MPFFQYKDNPDSLRSSGIMIFLNVKKMPTRKLIDIFRHVKTQNADSRVIGILPFFHAPAGKFDWRRKPCRLRPQVFEPGSSPYSNVSRVAKRAKRAHAALCASTERNRLREGDMIGRTTLQEHLVRYLLCFSLLGRLSKAKPSLALRVK